MYIYIHTYTYIYMYTHTYIYIIYIHIYIHILKRSLNAWNRVLGLLSNTMVIERTPSECCSNREGPYITGFVAVSGIQETAGDVQLTPYAQIPLSLLACSPSWLFAGSMDTAPEPKP